MKLTKRNLEAITPNSKRQCFFDDDLPGLAIRVSAVGKVSFYYNYRQGKGRGAEKKWIHIGAYPAWTPEQARQRVRELAAMVVNGLNPVEELRRAQKVTTLGEIIELFLDEHVRQKLKYKSIELYEGAIKKHILPALGQMGVTQVTHRDVAKIHHSLKDYPYMANRSVAIMSKFFNWCEINEYRERGSNPVTGLEKYKEEKKLDYLGVEEIAALGMALEVLEKSKQVSLHEQQQPCGF